MISIMLAAAVGAGVTLPVESPTNRVLLSEVECRLSGSVRLKLVEEDYAGKEAYAPMKVLFMIEESTDERKEVKLRWNRLETTITAGHLRPRWTGAITCGSQGMAWLTLDRSSSPYKTISVYSVDLRQNVPPPKVALIDGKYEVGGAQLSPRPEAELSIEIPYHSCAVGGVMELLLKTEGFLISYPQKERSCQPLGLLYRSQTHTIEKVEE